MSNNQSLLHARQAAERQQALQCAAVSECAAMLSQHTALASHTVLSSVVCRAAVHTLQHYQQQHYFIDSAVPAVAALLHDVFASY
jgi:serine acetyltransferase